MTTYVDTSALLTLFVDEADSSDDAELFVSAGADHLGVRSLDAIHLTTAQQLRIPELTFCTFDLRQGQAARRLGLRVLGC